MHYRFLFKLMILAFAFSSMAGCLSSTTESVNTDAENTYKDSSSLIYAGLQAGYSELQTNFKSLTEAVDGYVQNSVRSDTDLKKFASIVASAERLSNDMAILAGNLDKLEPVSECELFHSDMQNLLGLYAVFSDLMSEVARMSAIDEELDGTLLLLAIQAKVSSDVAGKVRTEVIPCLGRNRIDFSP